MDLSAPVPALGMPLWLVAVLGLVLAAMTAGFAFLWIQRHIQDRRNVSASSPSPSSPLPGPGPDDGGAQAIILETGLLGAHYQQQQQQQQEKQQQQKQAAAGLSRASSSATAVNSNPSNPKKRLSLVVVDSGNAAGAGGVGSLFRSGSLLAGQAQRSSNTAATATAAASAARLSRSASMSVSPSSLARSKSQSLSVKGRPSSMATGVLAETAAAASASMRRQPSGRSAHQSLHGHSGLSAVRAAAVQDPSIPNNSTNTNASTMASEPITAASMVHVTLARTITSATSGSAVSNSTYSSSSSTDSSVLDFAPANDNDDNAGMANTGNAVININDHDDLDEDTSSELSFNGGEHDILTAVKASGTGDLGLGGFGDLGSGMGPSFVARAPMSSVIHVEEESLGDVLAASVLKNENLSETAKERFLEMSSKEAVAAAVANANANANAAVGSPSPRLSTVQLHRMASLKRMSSVNGIPQPLIASSPMASLLSPASPSPSSASPLLSPTVFAHAASSPRMSTTSMFLQQPAAVTSPLVSASKTNSATPQFSDYDASQLQTQMLLQQPQSYGDATHSTAHSSGARIKRSVSTGRRQKGSSTSQEYTALGESGKSAEARTRHMSLIRSGSAPTRPLSLQAGAVAASAEAAMMINSSSNSNSRRRSPSNSRRSGSRSRSQTRSVHPSGTQGNRSASISDSEDDKPLGAVAMAATGSGASMLSAPLLMRSKSRASRKSHESAGVLSPLSLSGVGRSASSASQRAVHAAAATKADAAAGSQQRRSKSNASAKSAASKKSAAGRGSAYGRRDVTAAGQSDDDTPLGQMQVSR